ncbi:MAG TPA: hypothetical protein VIJ14_04115 [Rhabdochlamydiaceae bacterium]
MEANCEACRRYGEVDRAHILTVGSGAGWEDREWIYLCRFHHVESGAIGWHNFCAKFPHVKPLIESQGFIFVEIFGVRKVRRK